MNKLKTLFSTYLHKFTRNAHANPLRDWIIIIIIALLLLLGSALWSYWLFGQLTNASAPPASVGGNTTAMTNSLDTVEAIFAARAATESHYLTDYHFVDPSH